MTKLLFIILLMSYNIEGHEENSCPNICVCKWKGGKQTVECKDLNLNRIPENIAPSTQVLEMSGNNVDYLTKEIFLKSQLQNLQKIFFRNCNLKKIDTLSFKGLSNLIELDLSYNSLSKIPTDSLKYIPSLRELTLSGNPIRIIENYSFKNVPNLIKLDLSHCDVEVMSSKSFENLNLLQFLKINDNDLSEFNEHSINTLRGLHGIEMHNNPWFCDCKMRSIKLWLTENNIPLHSSPRCMGGPKRVLNRAINDMNIDEFACKPEMLPVIRNIEVISNTNATVLCKANAIPSAAIKWFYNGRTLDNNSAFSTYQKVFIYENEQEEFIKQSKLILTNSQEIESSDFFCVAENSAGNSQMNFTLHVTLASTSNLAIFNLKQNIGISLSLITLSVLFIILIVLFFILRLKNKTNMTDSKLPKRNLNNLELIQLNENEVELNLTNNKKLYDDDKIDNLNKLNIKKSNENIRSNSINNHLYQHTSNIGDTTAVGGCSANSVLLKLNEYNITPSYSYENKILNPDLINDTKQLSSYNLCNIENNLLSSIILTAIDNSSNRAKFSDRSIQTTSHYWHPNRSSPNLTQNKNHLSETPTYSNLLVYNQNDYENTTSDITFQTTTHLTKSTSTDEYHLLQSPLNELPISSSDYTTEDHILQNKSKTLPAYVMPTNAKTIRVWQSGGVSVLPPITALKRVLTNNRNSPDEGYQEGCGTDV